MIQTGQEAVAADFINQAERDATPANDAGRVPKLEADGRLHPDFLDATFEQISYPVVESVGTSGTTGTTAVNATMPSGIVAGDLLIAFFTLNIASGFIAPVGWTEIEGTIDTLTVYAKIAVGGDTFTATLGSTSYESATAIYRISNYWGSNELTDIVKSSVGYGQYTSLPNKPDNLYTHYLFIGALSWVNTGTVSTPPTGYGNRVDANGGAGTDAIHVATVYREARTIYEAPDAWTGASGTVNNRTTVTVSIRRAEVYFD